jgi:PhnB protein
MTINPYLNFPGTCEEAFNFYKAAFGGEFTYVGRFKDMPPQEGNKMSAADGEKIMHISLPIGPNTMIMGSDAGGDWSPPVTSGNNFSISINADSKADADRIFNALSKGGKVTMPLANTFWGDYFGMCTDKYNVNWMMSYNEQAHKA